jgi:N-acetyl-beta-hexosaminidase
MSKINWTAVAASIATGLLGFCSALLVVHLTLANTLSTLGNTIARHDVQIGALVDAQKTEAMNRIAGDEFITRQISDDRTHNDRAISELVQLQSATVKHADELISMLKLQRQFDSKP